MDPDLVFDDMPLEARFEPASINEANRTVDLMLSSGAAVRRMTMSGEVVDEELVVSPEAIRLDRLNNGAPLIDSHAVYAGVRTVLGVVERAWIQDGELWATVRFSKRVDVEAVFQDVKDGIIRSVSIGYKRHKIERIDSEEGGVTVYRVSDWEPVEVSLVLVPAEVGAGVRADETGTTIVETPSAKENRMDPEELEAARAEAIAAERKRAQEISDLVTRSGLDASVANDLVSRGVDIAAAREEVLEKVIARSAATKIDSNVSVGESHDSPEKIAGRMADALAHRFAPGTVKLTDESRQYAGHTPLDMVRDLIESKGERVRGGREALAERALTTSDFPLLLEAAANKTLQGAYALAEPNYRKVAAQKSFADFKPHKFLTVGDFPDLKEVAEDGEVQAGGFSENRETITPSEFARKIVITRKTLINDDLGALGDFTQMGARRVAFWENGKVMSLLADNAKLSSDNTALFHANHGNLGVAAALSIAALGKGRAAIRKQKSLDGLALNIPARYLVVSPDLETEAEQLTASIAAVTSGEVNPFSGKLVVISDATLTGSNWFLLADPADAPSLAYGYVAGQSGPRVLMEQKFSSVEFNLGVDFGAGVIDFRGAYKNPYAG